MCWTPRRHYITELDHCCLAKFNWNSSQEFYICMNRETCWNAGCKCNWVAAFNFTFPNLFQEIVLKNNCYCITWTRLVSSRSAPFSYLFQKNSNENDASCKCNWVRLAAFNLSDWAWKTPFLSISSSCWWTDGGDYIRYNFLSPQNDIWWLLRMLSVLFDLFSSLRFLFPFQHFARTCVSEKKSVAQIPAKPRAMIGFDQATRSRTLQLAVMMPVIRLTMRNSWPVFYNYLVL